MVKYMGSELLKRPKALYFNMSDIVYSWNKIWNSLPDLVNSASKGAFKTYVNKILGLFWPPAYPYKDIFKHKRGQRLTFQILPTEVLGTLIPSFVHVVFEWPLSFWKVNSLYITILMYQRGQLREFVVSKQF